MVILEFKIFKNCRNEKYDVVEPKIRDYLFPIGGIVNYVRHVKKENPKFEVLADPFKDKLDNLIIANVSVAGLTLFTLEKFLN